MAYEDEMSRRSVLRIGIGAALSSAAGTIEAQGKPVRARPGLDPDKGVTAPEDLMKEHGVLNRCLLIYEEGLRRLRNKEEVSPEVFHHTAEMVHTFVEEYHEQNEEKYIFPELEKASKLVELVK